ncbi:hypothetical protein ACN6MY_03780 [Peribacillus sp. B-H-3]|uniref:hypothetical protein n=1 Tax=Peribacillus sp. B-H-3 TaxID=3400420 RepID=UPI003B019EBA
MNEEFIARVVVAAGKTMDEFNREVEEIQSQGLGPNQKLKQSNNNWQRQALY